MNSPGDFNLRVVNKISQALHYCAVDILGQQVFEEKLNSDKTLSTMFSTRVFTMTDLLELLTILLNDYNRATAQGFSQRIGKVFFHYLRRICSEEIMNNSLEFRLLPFHQRVEKSLELFFQWLRTELDFDFFISRQKPGWKIQLETPVVNQDCALISYFFNGILLEFFDWMDCHYRYSVAFSDTTKDALQLVCFVVTYLPLE
jgi:hypothetical protein